MARKMNGKAKLMPDRIRRPSRHQNFNDSSRFGAAQNLGLGTVSWAERLRSTMARHALFLALPIAPELREDTLSGCHL